MYLNLKRIKSNEKSVENENSGTLSDKLAGVIVPKEWKIVEDNWNCITFTRLEKWQFDNRRAMTEVVVSQSGNSVCLTVKAHGCETDVSNVVLSSLSVKQQVDLAIEFVEKSTFCDGISLPAGENFQALAAHIKGNYRYLTDDKLPNNPTVVHFSTSCKIFASTGGVVVQNVKKS